MHFPSWVNKAGLTRAEKRSNRLQYLFGRIQLERNLTRRELAKLVGVSHSTICQYISQGFFSANMAMALAKKFGNEWLKAEWLVDPMSIEVSSK